MIVCANCNARAEKSDGRWASVLRDEPGSIAETVCPRCAAKILTGIEIDPDTKERTVNAFRSSIQRF